MDVDVTGNFPLGNIFFKRYRNIELSGRRF